MLHKGRGSANKKLSPPRFPVVKERVPWYSLLASSRVLGSPILASIKVLLVPVIKIDKESLYSRPPGILLKGVQLSTAHSIYLLCPLNKRGKTSRGTRRYMSTNKRTSYAANFQFYFFTSNTTSLVFNAMHTLDRLLTGQHAARGCLWMNALWKMAASSSQ